MTTTASPVPKRGAFGQHLPLSHQQAQLGAFAFIQAPQHSNHEERTRPGPDMEGRV
jgi:hypothetical protein